MKNFSLKLFNRQVTKGYDYSQSVKNITYTTNRRGSASSFTFEIVGLSNEVENGFWVLCEIDGIRFFRGYIFRITKDKHNVASILAYDQLRYLKTNMSYAFTGKSADEIILKIAQDFNLSVGELAQVPYKIPSLVCEDMSLFDIIEKALVQTQNYTGLIYVLYDDFGELKLKQASELQKNKIVGQGSAEDYTYTLDIDKETYNQIRLVKPNKTSGKADVIIVNDSSTIAKWGLLQEYVKVDENSNEAQMKESAETRLKYYNRVQEELSMQNVIGDLDLRAGAMIPIQIDKIDKFKTPFWLICEKVVHKIDGNVHLMDITCKIIPNEFYK